MMDPIPMLKAWQSNVLDLPAYYRAQNGKRRRARKAGKLHRALVAALTKW